MEADGRARQGIATVKRIFPKGTRPDAMATAVARMVANLDPLKTWAVEVTEWRRPRTNKQNAFLFGVCYPAILEGGGELLDGWTREDLHEHFLGKFGGVETLEGFGVTRTRPLLKSSRMNKEQFSEYLDWLSAECANMGIVIPEPVYE